MLVLASVSVSPHSGFFEDLMKFSELLYIIIHIFVGLNFLLQADWYISPFFFFSFVEQDLLRRWV